MGLRHQTESGAARWHGVWVRKGSVQDGAPPLAISRVRGRHGRDGGYFSIIETRANRRATAACSPISAPASGTYSIERGRESRRIHLANLVLATTGDSHARQRERNARRDPF